MLIYRFGIWANLIAATQEEKMKNQAQTHSLAISLRKKISGITVSATSIVSLIMVGLLPGALPQAAMAQSSLTTTATWQHCSPNRGAVGPFYVVRTGPASKGMQCGQFFLSAGEALGHACYLKYAIVFGGNDLWPQTTSSVVIKGFSAGDFYCSK